MGMALGVCMSENHHIYEDLNSQTRRKSAAGDSAELKQ
jgi:hypothetical protein